jgi:hypothetical protein
MLENFETLRTIEQKFTIGQRVMSKKTGYPAVGTIVGITHPLLWHIQNGKSQYWTSVYNDWSYKFIYTVMFDKKVPVCTREEFSFGYDSLCPEFYYQAQVQYSMFIAYPEDDLEVEC